MIRRALQFDVFALPNRVVSSREERKSQPLARGRLLAVVAISLGSVVFAQTPPAVSNEPQSFFYPAPPEGFNPVTASDGDLAAYGFPKRPALSDPFYVKWAKYMSNAKYRVANPIAITTNRHHVGPNRGPSALAIPAGGIANPSATNWSGTEVTYSSSSTFFAQNGSEVYIAFQVPTLGTESCTYQPYHTSIWTGFDGDANPDVLQAGVDVSNVASGGSCSTFYTSWYEWWTPGCSGAAPCYETDVSSLTINANDEMYITVTYNTTSPHGTAYISDQTTGYYYSVGFNQPSGNAGTSYAGSSAEWIVERPTEEPSGTLYDLGDYGVSDGPYGYLWMYPDYYTPSLGYVTSAGSDSASSVQFWTMYCTQYNWNPSSSCSTPQNISVPYYQFTGSSCVWPGTLCVYPTGIAASQE
jgi:hypothetical protein